MSERLLELLAEQAPQPRADLADDVLRSARRTRLRTWSSVGASAVVVGVVALIVALGLQDSPKAGPTSVRPASPGPSTSGPAALSSDAAIYVAVLRDRPHPDVTSSTTELYVLDHTCTNIVAAGVGPCDPQPIVASVQREIIQAMSGAVAIHFTDGSTLHGPPAVTVTLGPIVMHPDVTVPVSVYCDRLCAQGQTDVLTRRADGQWQVTGTTGAMWIS